jgi:hypothetical protein
MRATCEARIEEPLVEIRERRLRNLAFASAAPKRLPARNIRSLKIGPVRVADQETALRHSPLTALRRLEPQLGAAMAARIPGSVKGQERFVARLLAVPSPAIIAIGAMFGKRCKFNIQLSLWKKDQFGGAEVIVCNASADRRWKRRFGAFQSALR